MLEKRYCNYMDLACNFNEGQKKEKDVRIQ